MQNREYYGFTGWGPKDKLDTVANEFQENVGTTPDFVYAMYTASGYDKTTRVLYCKQGRWFYVEGGHCSCYGLEGQWKPEAVDPRIHLRALRKGMTHWVMVDKEKDYPKATQKHFDNWLKRAVKGMRIIPSVLS